MGGDARGRQLAGKVALITGAASGQGRAAAQLFADHGAAIVVVDVNDDGARETVERIEKDGGRATALHADVSIRADCDAMVAAAFDTFGRLDVLYNNAAIQMSGRLVDTTEEMWDVTIATNLSAIFWACRAAIPAHARRRRRLDRQHVVDARSAGSAGLRRVRSRQGRTDRAHPQIAVEYGLDRARSRRIDRHAALSQGADAGPRRLPRRC